LNHRAPGAIMYRRTFDEALASKPATKQHLTDAQWYVCLVVVCACEIKGLDSGEFKFTMTPPNPELQEYFNARIAPHHAATALFSVRH